MENKNPWDEIFHDDDPEIQAKLDYFKELFLKESQRESTVVMNPEKIKQASKIVLELNQVLKETGTEYHLRTYQGRFYKTNLQIEVTINATFSAVQDNAKRFARILNKVDEIAIDLGDQDNEIKLTLGIQDAFEEVT